MQSTDINHIQGVGEDAKDGDVLTTGEALLERAKAVSRQIRERVRQLAGDTASKDKPRSE
jgi:hypothetical protein